MADLKNEKPIFVICDSVRSLMNVGLIFRLCDALAVKKLYLCGITGHPKRPTDDRRFEIIERAEQGIKKTALSTFDKIDWEYRQSVFELVKELKSQGVKIVSLQQTENSADYKAAKYEFPLAIVLGFEVTGVNPEILDISDQIIEIPMHGTIDSLNVATAFAVLGYKLREN